MIWNSSTSRNCLKRCFLRYTCPRNAHLHIVNSAFSDFASLKYLLVATLGIESKLSLPLLKRNLENPLFIQCLKVAEKIKISKQKKVVRDGQPFLLYARPLLESVRRAILVVEEFVSLVIGHKLLNDRIPLEWSVELVGDVTNVTHCAR